MSGRMEESYFDEKKQFALDAIKEAVSKFEVAAGLISAIRYEMPDLANPDQIHETLKSATAKCWSARRDFEKARWAATLTSLEFEDWLVKQGHADLVVK